MFIIPKLSYEHFSEVIVNVNELQLIIPSEHAMDHSNDHTRIMQYIMG